MDLPVAYKYAAEVMVENMMSADANEESRRLSKNAPLIGLALNKNSIFIS